MRSFRVEPNQILHQDDIEFLGLEQKICMVIHELLLNGPIESLTMRIHLWGSWIGVVMLQMQFLQPYSEVFLELTAVVRQDMLEGNGEHHLAEAEKFFCCF